MFISEEIVHYVASFLDHYDIGSQSHKNAVKDFRRISDTLLENLYQPMEIKVIRKKKKLDLD
jgi:hypothetical protein